MGRLSSEELWRRHTLERFAAFKQSGELERLRKEGLAACGRKKRFTNYEWATSPMRQRYSSTKYMEWHHKCEAIAQRFGLAFWTVVSACLISGYRPEKEPFPVEGSWPRIRVVTEQTNTLFLEWLSYQAHQLGLYVTQRFGSTEVTHIPPNFPPLEALPALGLPPRDCAFFMRVETPPGYPPQGAANLEKQAKQLEKELFRQLGYPAPKRLRTSKLIDHADGLRLEESPLPSRGLYEIVAKKWKEGSVSEDEERRKLMKSRRHKLRQRLIKPYKSDM